MSYPSPASRWSRSDKIAMFTAVLGAVLAVVALLPYGISIYHGMNRPKSAISLPVSGTRERTNIFGAAGTAQNIPPSSDLWLVVRGGVRGTWYPYNRLPVSDGRWRVPARRLCPGAGPQDIEVYLVPDTDETELFDFIHSTAARQSKGISSLPPGSVLEAVSSVDVAAKGEPSC